jgi:hypothetical protein
MGKYAADETVVRRMISATHSLQLSRHFVVGQIYEAFYYEIKVLEGRFKVLCQQTYTYW